MAHMLLLTRGTGGDLMPFLALGAALRGRGHRVTLLSHCRYAQQASQAGLDFVALDQPAEYEHFLEDGPLLNSPAGIAPFFRRHILPFTEREYGLVHDLHTPGETVLLRRHMGGLGDLCAAEALDIPVVRLFNVVTQVTTLDLLATFYRQLVSDEINQLRARLSLPPIRDWQRWVGSAAANLASWPAWFAQPQPTVPLSLTPVGFMLHDPAETGELPEAVATLLLEQGAPVLITGGMGTFMGEGFYAAGAAACAQLGLPALLVTRFRSQVPQQLPAGVCWQPQLPFASLMQHTRAVIHHGGTSTLARALACGVPQLALAAGSERPDTGQRMERLGVGLYLPPPRWDARSVAAALSHVLAEPAIQERCRFWAGEMRGLDSTARACELVESALRRGPAERLEAGEIAPGEPEATTREARINALSAEQRALLARRLRQPTQP